MYYDFNENQKVFYISGYFNHEYYKIDYYYNKDLNDWKSYYEFVHNNSYITEFVKNQSKKVLEYIKNMKPSDIKLSDIDSVFNILSFTSYFYGE